MLPCKRESWLLASEMHCKYLKHCLLWLWSAAVLHDRILSVSFSQTQTKIQIMGNVLLQARFSFPARVLENMEENIIFQLISSIRLMIKANDYNFISRKLIYLGFILILTHYKYTEHTSMNPHNTITYCWWDSVYCTSQKRQHFSVLMECRDSFLFVVCFHVNPQKRPWVQPSMFQSTGVSHTARIPVS